MAIPLPGSSNRRAGAPLRDPRARLVLPENGGLADEIGTAERTGRSPDTRPNPGHRPQPDRQRSIPQGQGPAYPPSQCGYVT